ncbi:MAG: hypothetical protein HC930_12095 [Hydrococcus sp. SU_1_0]|nr:hypothetical protein [Hydrococcus sp. SU_1_0]
MPNGLTTGVQGKDGIEFPAAPNRWLIIRRQNSQETGRWVVESDYLHPPEKGYQENSITYPVTYSYLIEKKYQDAPRFCYLGRQLPWEEWKNEKDKSENRYLDKITAIGYGEATFAAFYPNCHSVFGFYDSFDDKFTSAKNIEYDVIGWYSNPAEDYLKKVAQSFIKQNDPQSKQLKEYLQEKLKWEIDDLKSLDNQMLCYARLSFSSNPSTSNNSRSAQVALAVGNTGGEALAAYLANSNKSQKTIVEEQLALIDLIDSVDSLNSDRPDFGAIFQQRQHQNSFNALAGGFIWEITVTKDSNQPENKDNSSSPVGLPQHLMTELNELNQKQRAYNCHQAEVDSMRYQLFSDWYKYMVSCYPLDTWDNYPDIDEIKSYIETCGLKPLEAKIAAKGELEPDKTGTWQAKPPNLTKSKANNIAKLINQLLGKIEDYNQELRKNVDNLTKITFKLEQVADARYWQPKEPVVLIVEDKDGTTGNALKATDRYNRNESLGCTVLSDQTIKDLIDKEFQSVIDKIIACSQKISQRR